MQCRHVIAAVAAVGKWGRVRVDFSTLHFKYEHFCLQSGKGQEEKKRTQPAAPKATALCCCCMLILSPQQLNIIRGKKGSRPLERESGRGRERERGQQLAMAIKETHNNTMCRSARQSAR